MRFFLKLKHWQVCLIWILGATQLLIFMKSDFWFISFTLYCGLIFLWLYSIGRVLNKKNPELIKRMNIWWVLYALSLFPFALHFRDIVTESYDRIDSWIIALSGLVAFIAITKIVIYTAKTIKKEEVNKNSKTSELFLIYFLIIGIWFLQPRLNRILDKK